jgi:hypothetical protein
VSAPTAALLSPETTAALLSWLLAFAFTQAVEIPLYRRAGAPLWVAFGASALTHPVVWFVFPRAGLPWLWMVLWAELFAWLAEALWLRWHGVQRPLLWSLLANGASLSLGLLSRELFGVP